MSETGWLLEREDDGVPKYLSVYSGRFEWNPDKGQALRLARRQDGDALAEIVEDAWRVREHRWGE